MQKWLLYLLVPFLLGTGTLQGQNCCSGGTPLSSNLGIQTQQKGILGIQLSYNYNTQRDFISGNKKVDQNNRKRDTHSGLLRASYAFTNRISVSTLFSLIQEVEQNTNLLGNRTTNTVGGIGDVVGLIQYAVIQKPTQELLIAGGVKAPLGSTSQENPDNGIVYNIDLQPGSGSWDYLMGLNYSINHLLKPNLNLVILGTYRISTSADRFDGQQQYKFGNELQSFAGFQDQYLIKNFLVHPSLLIRYRYADIDQVDGFDVSGTGGHWVHLVPGIGFEISPELRVGLSGEIPIYRNLNEIQLTTTTIITLALNYKLRIHED